jgi:hypothetical protein
MNDTVLARLATTDFSLLAAIAPLAQTENKLPYYFLDVGTSQIKDQDKFELYDSRLFVRAHFNTFKRVEPFLQYGKNFIRVIHSPIRSDGTTDCYPIRQWGRVRT